MSSSALPHNAPHDVTLKNAVLFRHTLFCVFHIIHTVNKDHFAVTSRIVNGNILRRQGGREFTKFYQI
jgi:hypothetical protein